MTQSLPDSAGRSRTFGGASFVRSLARRLWLATPLAFSRRWGELTAPRENSSRRDGWVAARLAEVPAGWRLIDVGAGECQYKKHCGHLTYTAQDVALYDGQGDSIGLQTNTWDFSRIDMVCDVLDIPEDNPYDVALLTEVLEHVADAPAVLRKMGRLVKPGGRLIITAPFCSFTHFAPYFHGTGFSQYFYRHHLEAAGFEIVEMTPNGGFFDYLEQEIGRSPAMIRQHLGRELTKREEWALLTAAEVMASARREELSRAGNGPPPSSELVTFGLHVVAKRV